MVSRCVNFAIHDIKISLSLAIIALLAGLFVLHWARAVFIPLMLGLVFSYALSPVVNWMESRRMPRALGAGIVILSLLAAMGTTTYYSISKSTVHFVGFASRTFVLSSLRLRVHE